MHFRKSVVAIVLVASVWAGVPSASAQNLVFAGSAEAGANPRVVTPAGEAPLSVHPLQRNPDLLIVLDLDCLDPSDYDAAKRLLTAAQKIKSDTLSIRLGFVDKGVLGDIAGPFRSAGELSTIIRKLKPAADAGACPPAADFFPRTAQSLAALPSDWGYTLLFARLPQFDPAADPALAQYATAWLIREFIAQKRTLVFDDPTGAPSAPAAAVSRATGSPLNSTALSPEDLLTAIADSGPLTAAEWAPLPLSHGFDVELVSFRGFPAFASVPAIAAAPASALPGIAAYAELRAAIGRAEAILSRPEGDSASARAELDSALRINSADRDAVLLSLKIAARENNAAAEIPLLETALELSPSDTTHWSRLGELQYRLKNFPAAERALLRARTLGASSAAASEQLGRIALGRNDLPAALDFIADSLRLDATQQPLWFLAADTAAKLNRIDRQTEALERGLALGGSQLARRIELIGIYLAKNDASNAARHVDLELPRLPLDADTQTTWAHFYEQLNRPEDALNCWKRVIAANPSIEPAHYAVASILWNAKRVPDALEAADQGLNAAPKSARIELVKIACLEQLDRIYAARRSLEAFARDADDLANDLAVLKREAEFTDRFGGPAPQAWKRYAEVLTAAASTDPSRKAELTEVLRRGAVVSAREGDAATRDWFEAQSAPAGASRSARNTAARSSEVWIAGGIDALGFMAGAQPGIPPDRFLVDFCRRIVSRTQDGPAALASLQKDLIAYFEALRQLFALATRTGDRATLTLSITSRPAQDQTEKVLTLLGWKLVRSKQKLLVQSSEKKDQARNQDLASALAIDQSGMQAAFQKGADFRIDLPFDRVPVLFDESTWRLSFRTDKLAGGLAEALVRTPDFARIYLALSNVDPATANVLFTNFGLNPKYSELLSSYSSALAVVNGRALVPGGVAAEPVWTRLAGAAPSDPARFFRALFDKDQGRLLIWFFQLSELDSAHQRFFTSSSRRIAAFYEAFSASDDVGTRAGRLTRSNTFSDFLRSIPLDGNSVNFPGSPEVWMVTTGRSVTAEQNGKLLKKARRAAAPEVEDEILLRLARLRDKAQNGGASATSAFLTVARIDEHRLDPLDDQSALILGQNYNEFQSFYPYFLEFRTLKAADFQTFFNFLGQMKVAEEGLADVTLGQFEALLEIIRLARNSGALPEDRGDALFRQLCLKFAGAQDAAGYTSASLDVLRELLGTKATPKDADAALAQLLLGSAPPVEIDLDDSTVSLDVNRRRALSYGRVLDLQKAPRVAALLRIDEAARRLPQGNENPAQLVESIARDADELPVVEVPKTFKLEGRAKLAMQRSSPAKLRQIAAELRQATLKKKPNPKEQQKLARDVLEELAPQVRIALTGAVYGVHFEATDILVENDPLLLRKHQSFFLLSTSRPFRFPGAHVQEANSGEGSYFVGSFALLALESASARSGTLSGGSGALLANQLATNRMTPWARYSDSDQRLLGSKLRMAREWCVYAASDPAVFAALSEDTLGVLSLSRRRQLLNAITERDINTIAANLTLSDLLALADRYLARYSQAPWPSPVDADLRRASSGADSALSLLGPLPATLYGCSHPHLVSLAPYEEYEHHLFPVEMAERSAEMKIYLAAAMDRAAIPAAAMAAIADDVTTKTFASMRMSDARDWTSALKAFGTIDGKTIRAAIEAANR